MIWSNKSPATRQAAPPVTPRSRFPGRRAARFPLSNRLSAVPQPPLAIGSTAAHDSRSHNRHV